MEGQISRCTRNDIFFKQFLKDPGRIHVASLRSFIHLQINFVRKIHSMPILCNYYLTYRCNAYCSFCHFGDHAAFKDSSAALTDDVLRNLHSLKKLGVRFIDFTGGEPLLHRDAALIVRKAAELGLKASITTNCLLYPKFAGSLKGNIYLLHFSLDSSLKREHDEMRGTACYDKVLESIRIARELGEYPDIIFTVTNTNYLQLPEVYEISRSNSLMLLINPVFEYFREAQLKEDILDYIEQFSARPMTYLNPSFITLRRKGGNDPDDPLCRAVSRVIVISPQNEILLPCYHNHFEKIPIGNDLIQAYKSERIQWHKKMEGRHAFCKGCTINCYFEPSFAFPTNAYALASVPSKIRYGFNKYVRQPISSRMQSL